MHNIKRYQTTQKQTHEGCTVHTAHNAQNVAQYHCSKNLFATLLDFPNHRFFLAKYTKLHEFGAFQFFGWLSLLSILLRVPLLECDLDN